MILMMLTVDDLTEPMFAIVITRWFAAPVVTVARHNPIVDPPSPSSMKPGIPQNWSLRSYKQTNNKKDDTNHTISFLLFFPFPHFFEINPFFWYVAKRVGDPYSATWQWWVF